MTSPLSGRRAVVLARVVLGVLLLGAMTSACARGPYAVDTLPAAAPSTSGEELTILLVRHAEAFREPGGDPDLTAEGIDRADRLAAALRDAEIDFIHSSGYRRTDQTAAPLAALLGLQPIPYDARDLGALAARLRESSGRHLVVGHSNTTPELVRLLGGEPGADIHQSEHDRLYVITRDAARVRTFLLRY